MDIAYFMIISLQCHDVINIMLQLFVCQQYCMEVKVT